MSAEDFSFPTIKGPFPCGVGSPPLWRLSPTASPPEENEGHDFALKAIKYYSRRKSFSCIEGCQKMEKEDHEEEKMDMLWEDFNEDLVSRSRNLRFQSGTKPVDDEMVQIGCVKALKLPAKNNAGAVLSNRKTGSDVIVNFLKKLFLLHNSRRKLKSRSW